MAQAGSEKDRIISKKSTGALWCTNYGALVSAFDKNSVNERAALSVSCDGFGDTGQIENGVLVKAIHISIPITYERSRYITIPLDGKTFSARDLAEHVGGKKNKPEELYQEIANVLKASNQEPIDKGHFNLVSIQIPEDTEIFKDSELKEKVMRTEYSVGVFPRAAKYSQLFACANSIVVIPGIKPVGAVFSGGDATHQPLFLLTGQPLGTEKGDVLFTLATVYRLVYQNGIRDQFVKVPGGANFPDHQFYYHYYSDDSHSNPFVFFEQKDDMKAKFVDLTDKNRIEDTNAADQIFANAILGFTDLIRDEFDFNPRYRSSSNLKLIQRVVDTCESIDILKPKIDFFATYVRKGAEDLK